MTTNYQAGEQSGTDIKEKLKQDMGSIKQDVNGLKQDVSEKARELKQEVSEKAREAARRASEQGKQRAEALSGRAADTLDKVEAAAEAEADALQEVGWDNLSHYIREMADGIGSLSDNLRNKSADELVRTATELARRNTGLFVLGAVAIGFGLSRFAKAAPRTHEAQAWGADSDEFEGDYGGVEDGYGAGDRGYGGIEGTYAYPAGESRESVAQSTDEVHPFETSAGNEFDDFGKPQSASEPYQPYERH